MKPLKDWLQEIGAKPGDIFEGDERAGRRGVACVIHSLHFSDGSFLAAGNYVYYTLADAAYEAVRIYRTDWMINPLASTKPKSEQPACIFLTKLGEWKREEEKKPQYRCDRCGCFMHALSNCVRQIDGEIWCMGCHYDSLAMYVDRKQKEDEKRRKEEKMDHSTDAFPYIRLIGEETKEIIRKIVREEIARAK